MNNLTKRTGPAIIPPMNLLEIHLYCPRPHHALRSDDDIGENQGAWIAIQGYSGLQHVLHVHQTGLTLGEAGKIAARIKPDYQAVGLHSCIPTKDDTGNPGSFILLKPKPR